MKSLLFTFLLFIPGALNHLRAEDAFFLEEVGEQHFKDLIENSPFTRTLNLSDSLILTGVAHFEGKPVATVLDTATRKFFVLSETPNSDGWKMISFTAGDDVDLMMAEIVIGGGEVVRVRYDKESLKNEREHSIRTTRYRNTAASSKDRSGRVGGGAISQERAKLLSNIESTELPGGYNPGAGKTREEAHKLHQDYVDNRMSKMSGQQKSVVGQLWAEKQRADPKMSNRGASFVKIMEHVAENRK